MSDWRLEHLTLLCLQIVDGLFWYRIFLSWIFRNFFRSDGFIDNRDMKIFRSWVGKYWFNFWFFLKISSLLTCRIVFLFHRLKLRLKRIYFKHQFPLVLIIKLRIALMVLRSLVRTLFKLRILYNWRQDSVIHKARPIRWTIIRGFHHFDSPMPCLFLIRPRTLSSVLFWLIRRGLQFQNINLSTFINRVSQSSFGRIHIPLYIVALSQLKRARSQRISQTRCIWLSHCRRWWILGSLFRRFHKC